MLFKHCRTSERRATRQVAAEFTCYLDLDGGSGSDPNKDGALAAEATRTALVNALVFSHMEAQRACEDARQARDQAVFVTPRHFIELMKQFTSVYGEKKSGIEGQQLHLSVGLQKLTQTHGDVETLALSLANREQQVFSMCQPGVLAQLQCAFQLMLRAYACSYQ